MARLLWSLSRRRITGGLAAIAAVSGLLIILLASPSGADRPSESRIRAATARYHSVDRALADGFVATDDCVELPGVGGMGYHFVNPSRLDATVEPDRPDILLYAKDPNGRLRLTGAEWFSPDPDQDLVTTDGRPTLFGHTFDGPMPGHGAGMPIHFDLHAWVWQDNPAGTFAPWNPTVRCG